VAAERLSEITATLYAELLDQCTQAEAEARTSGLGTGSFVSKTIRGATYWYFQQTNGGAKRQVYVGRETPALLKSIRNASDARTAQRTDEARRRELVRMLVAGGAASESGAVVQALSILSEAGVFRSGAVLIGTQAFACYGNMLGVRFERQFLRTADIDIAIAVTAYPIEERADVPAALKRVEPRFFSVPGLDPRESSTSLKVRGRDLRIDFVTTMARRGSSTAVELPQFRIAATPLRGIDFLIDRAVPAVIVGGSGVLVNVPDPARFALHKLWVAGERPVSEQAKARKDVAQAEQLLAVLAEDRPHDVRTAVREAEARGGMLRRIRAAARSMPETVCDLILA
jgi:hypothetical protein